MAAFEAFLPTLLKLEGGFTDDTADPGGATNKGVTLKTFQTCAETLLGVAPTLQNLKELTDEQAGVIYKALYWDRINGDGISLQELANIVFDFFVNAGAHATKLLQKVLNEMGASLVEDGVLGQASMQALGGADQREVYRRYKQGRIEYYKTLVQEHPLLSKFLHGWLNRVNSFPEI
jgi:lysozyme family protein